jgi:hypothetical protein
MDCPRIDNPSDDGSCVWDGESVVDQKLRRFGDRILSMERKDVEEHPHQIDPFSSDI